jgi:hypothetical protein
MSRVWNEAELQSHIDNFVEESLTLDYKAADSLAMTDGKKKEITKDVSAMANSAGGTIIYGLREHTNPAKKHLAEKIDPIDRTSFSKEWLEQVINNIRPRISGIIIHSVTLTSGPNDVAYVVEIPQSNTAHQATDDRYYKRFNFMSVPMVDHEIRDVMSRVTVPDVEVKFKYMKLNNLQENRLYRILPIIKNLGTQVVNNFKLEFTFPRQAGADGQQLFHPLENIIISLNSSHDYVVSYQSERVLFPNEERNIGEETLWQYQMGSKIYGELRDIELMGRPAAVRWTLYADNMTPKEGSVPFRKLHDY